MKKSMIFVGMLAIGYANAQEYDGKVGINTDKPKATLDITPEANNLTGTTNEGIIAPRLSKTRIANIEASKLTEGTLVYATDEATSPISAYTGADAKVAKITEKGYYFYNGTEWVKAGVGNEQEWKYLQSYTNTDASNPLNSTLYKQYAYVPSYISGDLNYSVLADVRSNDYTKSSWGNYIARVYDTSTNELKSEARLSGDKSVQFFSTNHQLGFIDFNEQNIPGYQLRIIANNTPTDSDSSNDNQGKQLRIFSRNRAGGTQSNLFDFYLDGDKTSFSNPNLDYVFGEKGFSLLSKKAVNSDEIGNYPYFTLNTKEGASNTGNNTSITWSLNRHSTEGQWKGTTNRLQKTVDIEPMGFIDFGINGITNEVATNNGLGFGYNDTVHAVIRENGNMGIGTTTPSEKLEVVGKIKTSSLAQSGAGDRVVYADENGVLKTGGSIAANNGVQTQTTMECNEDNRGKMNFGRISINSKETDAIGFCMKNGDNQFRWYYIYGGASHTVGTNANFGQGL